MTITLNGTTGITTPTYGGSVPSEYITPVTSFKNRIINGAMVIDQRNAGASVTAPAGGSYFTDRWLTNTTQASKFSGQQNAGAVTPPAGFTNYFGITSLSSYSVVDTDFFNFKQIIEANNLDDLGWGTANAQDVTVSFWVRSSLTGDFGLVLTWGGLFANERDYPVLYNIAAANTWEKKTITIAGDTYTDTFGTNGYGFQVRFSLGGGATSAGTSGAWATANSQSVTGETSVVGTNGATFYITGVQLEVGDTATSFDYRPYGQELSLCQRYFYKNTDTQYMPYVALSNGAGGVSMSFLPTVLRVNGTYTVSAGTNGTSFAVAASGMQSFTWVCTGTGAGNSNITGYTASAEL